MTSLMAETNNGFLPIISSIRVSAAAAEEAWKVLRTKCPVSEACNAVFAVSLSRISPTITTSGSNRSTALSFEAKLPSLPAAFVSTGICEMPAN